MRMSMNDFVGGSCEAVSNAHNFVFLWFRTRGNPCLQCGVNTETCDWHRQLTRTISNLREA